MTHARSRATSATVRYVCLILLLSMLTSGFALPLLLLAPLRYRRIYRFADDGGVNALLRAGAAHRGGVL